LEFCLTYCMSQGAPLASLLAVLSRDGALQILGLSSDGLISGKESIRRLGLSQKVYYSRLAELRELGLVERVGLRRYVATPKGRAVLTLHDRLQSLLSTDSSIPSGESRIIATYPEMVKTLTRAIDRADRRIKIATRYIDPTVAKSIFDAVDRNVLVEVIYKSGKLHLGALALELLSFIRKEVLSQAEVIRRHTRVCDIPFSFAVIDGQWSGIELVGPGDTFVSAVEFQGRSFARTIGVLFREYYRQGTEFPRFW